MHPRATRDRFQSMLATVTARPELHARWLNTLSLMEHIGSRKIVKALDSTYLTEELLQHIAEEARHAYFFKRLCHRVLPDACPTYEPEHVLCERASKDYFKQLDAGVDALLSKQNNALTPTQRTMLNYLGVTLVIEVRAGELYGSYEEVLRERQAEISLRSVIAEESRHLQEVTAMLTALGAGPEYIDALWQLEQPLFEHWLATLEHEVAQEAARNAPHKATRATRHLPAEAQPAGTPPTLRSDALS
jgi:hypothetical protein